MSLQLSVSSAFKIRTGHVVHQISAPVRSINICTLSFPIHFCPVLERTRRWTEIRGRLKWSLSSEFCVFALSQRIEIVMGDLSLPSRLATAAENLNIELSKEDWELLIKLIWWIPGTSQERAGVLQKTGNCLEAAQKTFVSRNKEAKSVSKLFLWLRLHCLNPCKSGARF